MTQMQNLTAQLSDFRHDLKAFESDTPRLEQMVREALAEVSTARAGLKASGDFETLTQASGKHSALEGLLSEHLGEVSTLRSAISSLETQIQTLEQAAQKQARLEHLRRALSTLEQQKKATLEALNKQVSETVDTYALTEKACNLAQRELITLEGGIRDQRLLSLYPDIAALQALCVESFHWPSIHRRVENTWGYREAESLTLLELYGL